VSKLKTQRGITIEHKVLHGANHFFTERIDELVKICGDYVDRRMAKDLQAV
jgi:alpha/beta superfamily hydrolase